MTTMRHERPTRHLGTDREGINPARRRAKFCVVQDHPAQAPIRAAGQLTVVPVTAKLAGVAVPKNVDGAVSPTTTCLRQAE